MKSLLIYLKNYRKETILAPFDLRCWKRLLNCSYRLLWHRLLTLAIAQKDSVYIVKMCLVLVALGIIGLICSLTAQYFSAKAAAGFGTGVRHALFAHIQHLGFRRWMRSGVQRL